MYFFFRTTDQRVPLPLTAIPTSFQVTWVYAENSGALRDKTEATSIDPDGPWHTLLRESMERADYRDLLAEMEADESARVSEPPAAYDVTRMTQRRLFD